MSHPQVLERERATTEKPPRPARLSSDVLPKVLNYLNGRFVESTTTNYLMVMNPALGKPLAQVPLSTAAEVDTAVHAAQAAFPAWRETSAVVRARYFFKLKMLLEERSEEIARLVTEEHGKTLAESRGDVRRAIENVEVAAGIPSLMMGYSQEDVAPGIDSNTIRRPLGVFAAITPFNFPAMVPLWFMPYAVACGNTFIVKPSEQVPLTQQLIFKLIHEVGFPQGVVNLINGAKEVVDAFCTHPGIRGVSFVGSSPVAKHVYTLASQHGKRVQALGGAKNFLVVMPDANLEATAQNISDSCFGCAGERCLAGSVVLAVGDIYPQVRDRLVQAAQRIALGAGTNEKTTMGPVISEKHKQRVLGYIEKGLAEGAKLILDGRNVKVQDHPDGYFIGPTIFDEVQPSMVIAQEEIFGPVLSIISVKDLDEAIAIIENHPLGNTTSIFTQSGKAAREFQYRVEVSMVGVNIGVPAPMAFFSFGGAKGSFFGDLKAHGRDAIEFYTDKKITISRW